jgi:hypothetical protein
MKKYRMNKIQLSLVTFGVIIGIVGVFHGIGQIVQGSVIIETNSVKAFPENWPTPELYTEMEGMPAFSILTGVPYYILGIIALIASIAMIIHSLFFINKKNGLIIFAVLNVGVFLFGGGIGTPIVSGIPLIIFGFISTRFNKKKERSESSNKLNLTLFKVFYWLQIFSWILFPGIVIGSMFGEVPEPIMVFDFWIMPISILGALIFALRYDNTVHN